MIEVVIGFDARRALHPRNYAKRFRANVADLIYGAACGCCHAAATAAAAAADDDDDDAGTACCCSY